MNIRRLTAATLCAAVLASPAAAAIFTSRAAFDAAVAGQTTATFDGVLAPGANGTPYAPTVANGGLEFQGTTVSINSKDFVPQFLAAAGAYGSDYLNWGEDFSSLLTIKAATLITAIGFDFMEIRGHAADFIIDVGGMTTVAASGMSPSFFGFTSDVAFDTILLSAVSTGQDPFNYWTMDNVSYGEARRMAGVDDGPGATVPEPGTWALMLTGFGGLGAMLRRRRARGAPAAA